jgi:NitT/TauT family transport system substrate-binding protein
MSKEIPLLPVKIAQWGQFHMLYLPLYVAVYGGMAKKLGLDITLGFAGNDDEIFHQAVTGQADFGFGDPLFVDIGRRKGLYGTCVALAVKRAALWGITHNPAIPMLQRIEDFVQLRLGTFPKPSTTYSLLEGLKRRHKRLLKSMQIVQAPIGEQAKLLVTDRADVILELEPMVSLAESKGLRAVFSIAQFYDDAAFTGLTVSEKTLVEKPEMVEKMVCALQHGLDICLKDKKTALAIAQQVFPDYPPDVLAKAIDRLKKAGAWPKTTEIDPVVWAAAVRLRQEVGDLPQSPTHRRSGSNPSRATSPLARKQQSK